MSDLKTYLVTFKDSASTDEVHGVKSKIGEAGGKVVDEFSLIKGFSAKLPSQAADFIKSHHFVHSIEEDSEVKTQ